MQLLLQARHCQQSSPDSLMASPMHHVQRCISTQEPIALCQETAFCCKFQRHPNAHMQELCPPARLGVGTGVVPIQLLQQQQQHVLCYILRL
jgi:hypothetical protein